MRRRLGILAMVLVLGGCAGVQRSCSSIWAGATGSDWIIVQYGMSGEPFNCWTLRNTSVTNEDSSDGVYWLDRTKGHLVHVSGWYNRIQVDGGNWDHAANLIGVDYRKCGSGKYPA